jgi:hypothetical protein
MPQCRYTLHEKVSAKLRSLADDAGLSESAMLTVIINAHVASQQTAQAPSRKTVKPRQLTVDEQLAALEGDPE